MAHYATVHCPISGFEATYYGSFDDAVNDTLGLIVMIFTRSDTWTTGEWLYTDPTKIDDAPVGWYRYGGEIREGYAQPVLNPDLESIIVTMLGNVDGYY